MEILNLVIALFLLLIMVAGLWRVLRGPTSADHMLTAQLFGTTAVACVLLLAKAFMSIEKLLIRGWVVS